MSMPKEAPSFVIDSLDHLVLTVASIEASKKFYTEVLGFQAEIFGDGRTALKTGHMKINLHKKGEEYPPFAKHPTPGSADLCFLTSTPLNKVIEDLNNKSVEIIEGPVYRTGAMGKIHSVYIRDPDGNLIEIANQVSAM